LLSDVANIQKGTSITREKVIEGNIPVIAGGQTPAYFHNKANRDGNIITVSASGAYAGFVNYFLDSIFASDCNTIQSKDENVISTKLIFEFLKSIQGEIYSLQRGQAQPHVYGNDLENIKIPLPLKDTQRKIINEIGKLEQEEKKKTDEIEKLKKDTGRLLPQYGNSKIQIIKSGQARGYKEFDFSEKHFASENFVLDERKLEKGDILINSTGVGTAGRVTMFDLEGDYVVDSHITILRLNRAKALPDYVLHYFCDLGFTWSKRANRAFLGNYKKH